MQNLRMVGDRVGRDQGSSEMTSALGRSGVRGEPEGGT